MYNTIFKKKFITTFPGVLKKNLRFAVLKLRILVDQIAERDVVEVVFPANEDVEFLVQNGELPAAHQAAQVELAEHAVELSPRYSAVVYAVVVLEQREHLYASLAHAICEAMHDLLEHLISILCESVQVRRLLGTVLNRFDQRRLFQI